MKRILMGALALSLFSAPLAASAATRNWLAAPELYYSPVPRGRHGKSGVAKAKRAARKWRRRHGRA